MTIYLLRHADAGNREEWDGPDPLRPLDANGSKQAQLLVDVLADRGVERVLSSPYVRCVQTVEPLADRLGLEVEPSPYLPEGADLDDRVALIRSVAGRNTVLCAHGDILPSLLERLAELDGISRPGDIRFEKASAWVLEPDPSGRIVRAEYLPPPRL